MDSSWEDTDLHGLYDQMLEDIAKRNIGLCETLLHNLKEVREIMLRAEHFFQTIANLPESPAPPPGSLSR